MTRRRARGFTLLEVLVALAIMGMSLGLLFRAGAGALRDAGAIGRLQEAILVAESLGELHDSVPAQGWNEAGRSAGYAWQVASAPYGAGAADIGRVPLHEVRIVVAWDEGGRPRSFERTTLLPEHRMAGPGAPR
jgi:general secretion pathway protein I